LVCPKCKTRQWKEAAGAAAARAAETATGEPRQTKEEAELCGILVDFLRHAPEREKATLKHWLHGWKRDQHE
jgi:hypothetical protein